MEAKKVVKELRALLGMEVKLEQMKLVDGTTVLEADAFEKDKEIFVVTPDGNVAVPVGEYELENGQILVVVTEGVIAEIKDAAEEENPAEEVTEPAEQEMSAREPKKTIESTIKETLFAKIEEQATLIETLKNEITELKQVQLSAVEEVKPILHNPESRTEKRPVMKQTANHTMTAQERILNKLYN
jgi:hypothetical protein